MPSESVIQANSDPEYTLPPFLRRVRIRGYKSIEFCDVRLHPLTILVGRNAAGKSNFLDALAFMSDLMDHRVTEAVNERKGWRAIHCQGNNQGDIEFQAEFDFESESIRWTGEFGFSLEMNEQSLIRIRKENLSLTDGTRNTDYHSLDEKIIFKGDFDTETIRFTRSHSHYRLLLSVIGRQPFLDLSERLRASCVYNFLPDEIRRHQVISSSPTLNRDGGNLARAIEGIREIDPKVVERVKSYLRLIVPDIADVRKQAYGDYETLRFVMKSLAGQAAREFDASSMSDGTLRVLAALVAAFQFSPPVGHPGFIGIEEPETALHPAAMRALVDALDEATQRTQIFLTTHSADLLSGRDVSPGQVLIVRNQGGKTQITPLDQASREIIEKELYSLADLQRMDKLDLDEADLRRQTQLSQEGT